MRGRIYLLFLLLLTAHTYAGGQDIGKPWHEGRWLLENPNIFYGYGIAIWWNMEELSTVIDSLNTELVADLEIDSEAIQEKVEAADSKYEDAKYREEQCTNQISGENVAGIIIRNGVIAGISPILETFVLASDVWNGISPCIEYPDYWKGAMDNSIDALQLSMDATEKELANLETEFEKIEYAGLCNEEYFGPGKERCVNASAAILATNSNTVDGDFGEYVFAKRCILQLKEEVNKPLPKMSNYSAAMVAIWGDSGAVKTYISLKTQSDEAMKDADDKYELLNFQVGIDEGRIDELCNQMKSQNLNKINKAVKSSTIGGSSPGTIAERLEQIEKKKDTASSSFVEASHIYDMKSRDYLYLSIDGLEDISSEFESLEGELGILLEDAKKVTKSEKEEAKSLIDSLEAKIASEPQGSALREHLNKALEEYQNGEDATTIGYQYKYYFNAAAEARSALSSGLDYSEEADVNSLVNEVTDLLLRAETDDIPVVDEQAEFDLLKTQIGIPGRLEYLQNIKERIVDNARIKYGHLENMRTQIYSEIALAGDGAADLSTEMRIAETEVAFRTDGSIDYELSVGNLKLLENRYLEIESSLEEHIASMVSNSMRAYANPVMGEVALDKATTITLDLLLANAHEYGADDVRVALDMPIPLRLLYSDIIIGREAIESIQTGENENSLIIGISHVDAFESFHIVFEKELIIAHTKSMDRYVQGLGDGDARAEEIIEFELDIGINSLELPEYVEEASIDNNYYGRRLSAGEHILEANYLIEDAYTENIENVHAIQIGLNTEVSYDIVISPEVDMDKVTVYFESFNDSRVSNIDVYAVTGERTENERQISQTVFMTVVLDVEEGIDTRLKITYDVEELESFVSDQLSILDSGNHSESITSIIADAHTQATAGNYTNALAKIEEAKAGIKKENSEKEKAYAKYEKIKVEVDEELVQIGTALASASDLGVEGPFIAKLTARAEELRLREQEAEEGDVFAAIEVLDEIDLKWMDNEIKALRKEMYKEYNGLRERFVESGNLTTPKEFLDFESEMNKLEVGSRAEYAVNALYYLQRVRDIVESSEAALKNENSLLQADFSTLKGSLMATLGDYIRQKDAAKGTDFSGLFKYTEKSVKDKISEAEERIDDADAREVSMKLDELETIENEMQYVLDSLKRRTEEKIQLLESELKYKKNSIPEDRQKEIERKIQTIKELFAAGEYVNALRAGDTVMEDLSSAEEGDNGLLILAITAIAILATIAVYIMQNQKEFGLKKEKKMKKLEKIGNEESEEIIDARPEKEGE